MSRIENLEAVATDYDMPVTKLIDFVVQDPSAPPTPIERDLCGILTRRAEEAERLNLHPQYISGLKDARKLLFGPDSLIKSYEDLSNE